MGYTHYWKQSAAFEDWEWKAVLAEAKRIVAKAERGLYSGPEDINSQTNAETDAQGFRKGFNEKGAWRAFPHADQPIPTRGKAIHIAGGDGTGKPEFTDAFIRLNGGVPHDYETFFLERSPEFDADAGGKLSFAFCKTEYRPYDAVVVSILAAARRIARDKIRVTSDGGDAAIKLVF